MKHWSRTIGLLLMSVLALLIPGAASEAPETADGAVEPADLIIDIAELTEEPLFIDWVQDEIPMQLIALVDPEGAVRLAFNTCQSCNGSPWAWFEYIGNGRLQCQNCMQKLPLALVGTEETMGCAPISILEFTEEDGFITVPEHVLADAVPLFRNWRITGE